MKRTHIMIAVFFACILSPNLLFPILKTTADEGTGENRSLAAFPTLSLETIDTFPSGVEDWINDHAAFRNRFLSLNARLNLSLFQFGDSQDVITGKDGWYFYTLGSSVEDFLGTNRFSAGELQMLADKLQTIHDAWKEKGTEFIFLCAPNKEGVYSEFLPDGFTAPDGPTRRSELLAQILDNARAAALAGVIALRRFGAHIRHSRALIGNQPVERGADDAGEQLHRRAVIFLVTVGHHILHIERYSQNERIVGLTCVEHKRPLMQQSQRTRQSQADADTLFFFLFLCLLEERLEYLLRFFFGYFRTVATYADREVAVIFTQIDRNLLVAVFQGVIEQVAQDFGYTLLVDTSDDIVFELLYFQFFMLMGESRLETVDCLLQ